MREDQTTYIARASNPAFGSEVVDGRVGVGGGGLRFEDATGAAVEIPLNRVEIAAGESGEVCFSDPEQPEWTIYTFDQRILNHHALSQLTHTRLQIREMRERKETKWRLKVTVWSAGILVALALILPAVMGLIVRVLVARVPASVEQKMGNDTMAELKNEKKFLSDPKLKAKLESAVGPLITALPRSDTKYTLYITDEDEPNAFALPGGHVLVTRGLLTIAERPEEVAGAIAHEVAHVTEKHILRQQISSLGPFMLLELFASSRSEVVGALGAVSQLLVIQSFSQEYELEADAVGWKYMVAAQIDPRGMIDMLKKLKAYEDKEQGGDLEIAALSSHPATAKRIAKLEAKWKKLNKKSGFIEFEKWEATPAPK